MIMSVVTYTLQPGKREELLAFTQEQLPVIMNEKGFRGYSTGFDETTNKGVTVVFWDNREAADAVQKNFVFQEAYITSIDNLYTCDPVFERFEVIDEVKN